MRHLGLRQGIGCDRISYSGEGPWEVVLGMKSFLEIVQIFSYYTANVIFLNWVCTFGFENI